MHFWTFYKLNFMILTLFYDFITDNMIKVCSITAALHCIIAFDTKYEDEDGKYDTRM